MAVAGDALVGAVQVQVYDTPRDPLMVPARRSHVVDLVVDEAHRRRGVGRRLMEEAASWSRRQGAVQLVLSVWSENEEAEGFYRQLGYRPLNRVLGLDLT